jgi:hypothetical protein
MGLDTVHNRILNSNLQFSYSSRVQYSSYRCEVSLRTFTINKKEVYVGFHFSLSTEYYTNVQIPYTRQHKFGFLCVLAY